MPKRVTLKDIANETGYAVITVSKALRDENDIADATKKRIRETAEKLGYIKNYNAMNLKLGETKTIALIISDIINPLFSIIVKEAENFARENGYTITVMNTAEKIEYERQAVETAVAMNVSGVMLFSCQQSFDTVETLKAHNMPCVLMCRQFEKHLYPAVLFEDFKGGYLAAEFLLKKGYTKILMLNAPLYISSAYERYRGYLKAHHDYGIKPDEKLMISCSSTIDGYSEKMNLIPELDFDAVFAFNDILAFEAINALGKRGIRVPEDIGIVGFDDIMSAIPFPFPLTTVSAPKEAIAREAGAMLLNMIENNTRTVEEKRLDVSLAVRKSTR